MNNQPVTFHTQNNENNIPFDSLPKEVLCQYLNANSLQIMQLNNETISLRMRIDELEKNNATYGDIIFYNKQLINEHEMNIDRLIKENELLKLKIQNLENDIDDLKTRNKIFDALIKLHECNSLVNKAFKSEYKRYFKKGRYEYIPNIGDFINDPPTDIDDENYMFWNYFNNKYPGSDEQLFRNIYHQINKDRANSGAHTNVSLLTKNDFDQLIQIAYPDEYRENQKLYSEYRDWLYSFPP